jgi:hypothetical protein
LKRNTAPGLCQPSESPRIGLAKQWKTLTFGSGTLDSDLAAVYDEVGRAVDGLVGLVHFLSPVLGLLLPFGGGLGLVAYLELHKGKGMVILIMTDLDVAASKGVEDFVAGKIQLILGALVRETGGFASISI